MIGSVVEKNDDEDSIIALRMVIIMRIWEIKNWRQEEHRGNICEIHQDYENKDIKTQKIKVIWMIWSLICCNFTDLLREPAAGGGRLPIKCKLQPINISLLTNHAATTQVLRTTKY